MGRKGLRIEVRMRDTFTGRELWIDATCVHVRVPLRLTSELASANPAPPNQTTPPMADILDETKHKYAEYAPLLAIAVKQLLDGN
jgi:hypothetical protein